MNELSTLEQAAVEMLTWLDEHQHAGSLSASVVARLVNATQGLTIAYRESDLVAGPNFVRGFITVLTERHIHLLTLTPEGDLGGGTVSLDVFARSTLRHLRIEGSERMSDNSWSDQDRASVVRRLVLQLTYADGTAGGRSVTLSPYERGRLRAPEGEQQQAALVSGLLDDLAR